MILFLIQSISWNVSISWLCGKIGSCSREHLTTHATHLPYLCELEQILLPRNIGHFLHSYVMDIKTTTCDFETSHIHTHIWYTMQVLYESIYHTIKRKTIKNTHWIPLLKKLNFCLHSLYTLCIELLLHLSSFIGKTILIQTHLSMWFCTLNKWIIWIYCKTQCYAMHLIDIFIVFLQ